MRRLQTFFTYLESTCTQLRYLFSIHYKRACLLDKGNFLLLLKGKIQSNHKVIMSFFLCNCEVKVMVTCSFNFISHCLSTESTFYLFLIFEVPWIYAYIVKCCMYKPGQHKHYRHDNLTRTSFKTPVCTQDSQGTLRHQIFIFSDSSIGFFVDVTQSHLRVSKDFR